MASQPEKWPALSGYLYITGRAATAEDVNAGKAVFVLQADGKPIGRPLNIKIPQHAFHVDQESKQRKRCVVIQAEEARGQRLVGCRTLPEGEFLAGLEAEFELLGDKSSTAR